MAGVGDNGHLKSFIERIELVEADKRDLATDLKEIYAEAKSNGFDVKAMRAVISRRKQDAAKLAAHDAAVGLYLHALGDLADLPLGQAAMERVRGGAEA